VREEDNGPQFYSLSRVLCALLYAGEKEAQEQAERDWIEVGKVTTAANKVHKEQEKAERALRTAERRCLAAEKKIQHAVNVQARKELRIVQRAGKNAVKLQRKDRIPPTKITKLVPKSKESVVVPQNEVGLY
jgi:hypothetical protein